MTGTIPRRAVLHDGVWTCASSGGFIWTCADSRARSEGWVIEAEQPEPEPGARIVPVCEQFAAIKARLDQIETEAV